MDGFYVLRLGEEIEVVRLWAPEALGYVWAVEQAGVFSAEEIAADPKRYNDRISAAAVPCALVESVAVRGTRKRVPSDVRRLHVVPAREVSRLVRAAARVAAYRAIHGEAR